MELVRMEGEDGQVVHSISHRARQQTDHRAVVPGSATSLSHRDTMRNTIITPSPNAHPYLGSMPLFLSAMGPRCRALPWAGRHETQRECMWPR